MQRYISDGIAMFGDGLTDEIARTLERDPEGSARSAIALLLLIATASAKSALWAVARDGRYLVSLRLAALWGLSRAGESVDPEELRYLTLASATRR